MKTKFLLVAGLAAGALAVAAADTALAKGQRARNRRTETVRLARPADAPDENAGGSITITTTRRGERAVLHAKGLDPRSSYQVTDGQSGDVVGTLRTNARGRGEFSFAPAGAGKRRADSADGSEMPDVIDVVDPDSGDTVLTGDTTGELQYLYGYAMLGNLTESATITMGSDPSSDSQYFYFTFQAEPTDEWYAGVYEMYRDTSGGDELPLGAESVLDLAGKDFQVRNAAGDVVFRGTLPDVEAYDLEDPCPGHDDGGDDGGIVVPFDFDEWADLENPEDYEFLLALLGGMPSDDGNRSAYKGGRDDGTDGGDDGGHDGGSDEEAEFTLWIEGPDGFVKAGDLVEPTYCVDPWEGDWTWDDSWYYDDGGYDWSWDWGWDADGTWEEEPSNSTGDGTRRR